MMFRFYVFKYYFKSPLGQVLRLYLDNPQGVTDEEVSLLLHISRASASRCRRALAAIQVAQDRYTVLVGEDDVEVAEAILRRVKRQI